MSFSLLPEVQATKDGARTVTTDAPSTTCLRISRTYLGEGLQRDRRALQEVSSCRERRRLGRRRWPLGEFPLAKDRQDISSREDVKELVDVCARREIGPFVFIQRRHLSNRHVAFIRQRRDDSPLVRLFSLQRGHGEFLG
jgi:hypothetical protein